MLIRQGCIDAIIVLASLKIARITSPAETSTPTASIEVGQGIFIIRFLIIFPFGELVVIGIQFRGILSAIRWRVFFFFAKHCIIAISWPGIVKELKRTFAMQWEQHQPPFLWHEVPPGFVPDNSKNRFQMWLQPSSGAVLRANQGMLCTAPPGYDP